MRTRGITTLLAAGAAGAALAGCGAAQTISQAVDPVARAADVTAQAPGFRIAMTLRYGIAGKTVGATMTGEFTRRPQAGSLTGHIAVPGHPVTLTERLAGSSLYLRVPGAAQATGGKPWIKISTGGLAAHSSLGGLPNASSDPSRFVDYLRAAGNKIIYDGPATVRGIATKRYHAEINLDRYAAQVPAANRALARHAVADLEAALGSHLMPVDVWLDHQGRVRQMHMSLAQCVAGHRLSMEMTMSFYDFGAQTIPAPPPPSQVHDLTAQAKRAVQQTPPGCTG